MGNKERDGRVMAEPKIADKELEDFENKIADELLGEVGWWKVQGLETCLSAGKKLLDKGFSVAEAYDVLEEVLWAGINERGG